MSPKIRLNAAFTLVELAVVLTIIGVVIGGGLMTFTAGVQKSQYDATTAKMDVIEKALLDYSVAMKRLPCPSDLTALNTASTYGTEVNSKGVCGSANNVASNGVAEGGVPVRALQLPDSYMYDAWGRRFRYAVDPSYTYATGSNGSLPPPIGGLCQPSTSSITVNDINGNARSTAAVYALVSHGANGHGGYTLQGKMYNASSANADEQTNCHCNSSATFTSFSGSYVQEAPSYQSSYSGNNLRIFDDIVSYKESWQLWADNSGSVAPACMFMGDYNNNVFWQYNFNTQTWTNPTISGLSAPQCIAVDSSGNIYVGFGGVGVSTIKKYTNSTKTWATWSATGVNNPTFIAFDSSGYVYVANYSANTITKYATSGGAAITTLTHSFTGLQSLFFDSSGALWVTDNNSNCSTSNNCLMKYSGGSWTTIGSYGTTTGKFKNPEGAIVDAQGYLWVADAGNNRVQKCLTTNNCNTASNWTTYGSTSGGTAAGQFYGPSGVWSDPLGNIWVPDMGTSGGGPYNRRVQMYNRATDSWSIVANMSLVANNATFYSWALMLSGR